MESAGTLLPRDLEKTGGCVVTGREKEQIGLENIKRLIVKLQSIIPSE